MCKYVRHSFYPDRVYNLEEEIKKVLILFYISDIIFQIIMTLIKILHSSFTWNAHSFMSMAGIHSLDPFLFLSFSPHISFVSICLLFLSLTLLSLSHIFWLVFPFLLHDVLFSFFLIQRAVCTNA